MFFVANDSSFTYVLGKLKSPEREDAMKCPSCGSRTAVDIDLHSEGFTRDENPVKECGECGLVWRIVVKDGETRVDIIKQPDKK